jgi:DNA replication protein DnaC
MNNPEFHDIARQMVEVMRTITPERIEEAEARERDYQQRLNAVRIQELQRQMNAPALHMQSVITPSGEWGALFERLRAKLGSGMLVVLAGTRGNGKTQMAVELMKIQTMALKSARFVTAMEFFMAIKATYKRDSEKTEMDVIREFRKPSLLVVDEIGRRGETDWENNLLFELLNGRYNDRKDSLLLCNLTPAELQSSLGPSLISRLNESGGLIQCNWPSFR